VVCERDLEGFVGKLAHAPYVITAPPSWVKVINPTYSQIGDRHEVFARHTARHATGPL